jgi:hypothetical protein
MCEWRTDSPNGEAKEGSKPIRKRHISSASSSPHKKRFSAFPNPSLNCPVTSSPLSEHSCNAGVSQFDKHSSMVDCSSNSLNYNLVDVECIEIHEPPVEESSHALQSSIKKVHCHHHCQHVEGISFIII